MTTPYYTDEQVTLYCGDFRELLPQVLAQHGEPDLTLTDPPYGETSLTWDRWPDGWPQLIPGRSMWCFGSMRMFLDRRDDFTGWKLSQDVVWEKHNGSGFATDRFKRVHEFATHWYRGDWSAVHHETPRTTGHVASKSVRIRRPDRVAHAGNVAPVDYVDDGTRLARSVIRANSMHGTAINETEKPSGLVEQLVTYGCPPGGLVLDVFAGGCSALVAARNSGRRAVGIELREEQCAKAVEWRLSQAVLPFGEAS
jgi:site-specific DNA-methyltransferase (adenine-specific)